MVSPPPVVEADVEGGARETGTTLVAGFAISIVVTWRLEG